MAGPVLKGHAIAALVMGVIELLCGILIIALSVAFASKANTNASSSWWSGLLFAVPGILGIIVGATKNKGVMIGFMVLNIIATVLQGIFAIIAVIILAIWATISGNSNCEIKYGSSDTCECTTNDGTRYFIKGMGDCKNFASAFSLLAALFAFLLIGSIIALAGSILGCISVCCTQNQGSGGVVIQQQMQPQHVAQQPHYVAQPPPYSQPEPTKQ